MNVGDLTVKITPDLSEVVKGLRVVARELGIAADRIEKELAGLDNFTEERAFAEQIRQAARGPHHAPPVPRRPDADDERVVAARRPAHSAPEPSE